MTQLKDIDWLGDLNLPKDNITNYKSKTSILLLYIYMYSRVTRSRVLCIFVIDGVLCLLPQQLGQVAHQTTHLEFEDFAEWTLGIVESNVTLVSLPNSSAISDFSVVVRSRVFLLHKHCLMHICRPWTLCRVYHSS